MSETPPNVAQHASLPDALPQGEITVLGIFMTPETATALLRSPRGEITRLSPGESAFGVTLTAVADDAVMVQSARGAVTRLTIPG